MGFEMRPPCFDHATNLGSVSHFVLYLIYNVSITGLISLKKIFLEGEHNA